MQDTVILQSFAFLERTSPFFKCHAMTNTHVGWYLTYKEDPPPQNIPSLQSTWSFRQ